MPKMWAQNKNHGIAGNGNDFISSVVHMVQERNHH